MTGGTSIRSEGCDDIYQADSLLVASEKKTQFMDEYNVGIKICIV